MFERNLEQEAELKRGPFLIQAGESWGGGAIGQGGPCLIQNGEQGARGGLLRHLWLLSVWCPLVSSPFESHSLPSLLDRSRKVDLNSSVSATSTMIKAWPVLLLCSGIPVRILGKMAHLLH